MEYEKILNIQVGVVKSNIDEISHRFYLENESDNIIDFYIFCLDISRSVINKSLKLENLPNIHETLNDSPNEIFFEDVIQDKINQLIHIKNEQNKLLNEINPDKKS